MKTSELIRYQLTLKGRDRSVDAHILNNLTKEPSNFTYLGSKSGTIKFLGKVTDIPITTLPTRLNNLVRQGLAKKQPGGYLLGNLSKSLNDKVTILIVLAGEQLTTWQISKDSNISRLKTEHYLQELLSEGLIETVPYGGRTVSISSTFERMGRYNPKSKILGQKRTSTSLLPIAIIGGLAWLIYKYRSW